jgi:hypothetical protein
MTRKIRSLVPQVCPQCEAKRSFSILKDRLLCRRCGHVLRRKDHQPRTAKDVAPGETATTKPQPTSSTDGPRKPLQLSMLSTFKAGDVSSWARASYNSGVSYLRQEKWQEAVESFQSAINRERNFLEAHYALGLLLNNPVEKRKHLGKVVALNANHLEAIHELMILDGKIDADSDALNPYAEPEKIAAGGAVGTETENLRCSLCGSTHLTTDDVTGLIVCDACGDVKKKQRSTVGGSLTMALLQRRSQEVQWIVGERLLACESCGAERTIPSTQLSQRCPFCDSKHVIERDVLGSFQQPDGLITFDISQKEAEAAIQAQLEGATERIKGWFGSNKVKQMTMQGVYLPFWIFDCTVDVRRTVIRRANDSSRMGYQVPVQETFVTQDMKNNVPIAAVKSPPKLLTKKLGDYNWRKIAQYEPALLAEHAAQIYSMDFDEASLEARSVVGRFMRARQKAIARSSETEVNVFVEFKQMSFQLVLLPVWVATLIEEDDDIRSALVNGQTGKVVLGKARKPEK